jgi:hypothetical protein
MAWSWSHTAQAYADAEENLEELPRDTLEEILAEWECHRPGTDDFAAELWETTLANVKARELPTDVLADAIWDRASEQQTCDNGGFNAWMCPYGCGPHTVPFNRETEGEGDTT